MRIKSSGQVLYLYRYGGHDKASNRTLEVKIGCLPVEAVPVVGTDLDLSLGNNNIPIELWEALTVIEQRKLVDYLKRQQEQMLRGRLATLSDDLHSFAGRISRDLVDKKLADGLHAGISMFRASLKKAGYTNPRQKHPVRVRRDNTGPSTDCTPEAVAIRNSI